MSQRRRILSHRRRLRSRLVSSYNVATRWEVKLGIGQGEIQNSRGKDYIIRSSHTDVNRSATDGCIQRQTVDTPNGHIHRQEVLTLCAN